jgi:hypothetical protein
VRAKVKGARIQNPGEKTKIVCSSSWLLAPDSLGLVLCHTDKMMLKDLPKFML